MFKELNQYNILNIYSYGSRVYKTFSEGSDYDYIIVIKDPLDTKFELISGNCNFTIYNQELFQEAINNHEISVLECLFLPENEIVQKLQNFEFQLNKSKLRASISKKASNSFVKAKKKLIIEKNFNPYIAKKSLFHSLRMLIFGIQIAQFGKIVDYTQANYLWEEIKKINSNDWDLFKEKFQPTYNNLASQFRLVAPK